MPIRPVFGAIFAVALSACGTLPDLTRIEPSDGAPGHVVDVSRIPDAVPRAEPFSKYGNPASYLVGYQRYYVLSNNAGYVERGVASWYGTKFHGRRTSSGEPYDMYAMTAAHKTLPLPTYAQVTNLRNGRTVVVKINDRGPFKDNRLIDLSYAAAIKLGITAEGTGLVEVRALDPATYQTQRRAVPDMAAHPGNPGLYLQIGAFSSAENAERLRTRLGTVAHANVRIVRAEIEQRTVYRVRIGPIAGVDEADRMSRELAQLGLDDSRIVID
ncbi:MAG: septal ring lytic transglycosylase RlpA family protein [Gammaproteobacteria bacterium]|nr:septal ring lytic transglycosylase RlpA family protein [Gammaproteobacteria bacterium]